MFSEHDILEIYRFLPPEKQPTENFEALPLFIRTLSGHGFVTEHSLRREFERLVTGGPSRISLSNACSKLDVDTDVILQLVRTNLNLALLNRDQRSIILKQERDAIVRELAELLNKQPISKTNFAQSQDLDGESLEGLLQVSSIKENLGYHTEDYLVSTAYEKVLSNTIHEKLVKGLDEVETIELKPQSLPGAPPTWLIQKQLDNIRGTVDNGSDVVSQYHIEQNDDFIHCTPKKSVMNRRDKLLSELQTGMRFSLPLKDFFESFKEVYQTFEALEKHLSSIPSIIIIRSFAISDDRLSGCSDKGMRVLDDQGYINLKTLVPPETPREIEDDVQTRIIRRILLLQLGGSGPLRQHGDYWLRDRVYDSQRQALLDFTKAQAKRQWELLKEVPEKDPKFHLAEVVASIPDDEQLLRFLAQAKELETAASEHFTAIISDLDSQNEKGFSTFWTERVPPRVYNYTQGIKLVRDAKLQEQVSDLLSGYLQKEFLPDIVSKARSQGLVCSRRTRKNVNKFESTLKTSKSDLTSVMSTLEKFSKKQSLAEAEAGAAEEAKKLLMNDVKRRMQKPKTDAPLMFLSLVIILFAKHYQGVVYATGKFAPKLLKQLKTQLSSEEYEQVEKWKESAKTGVLDKEDREAMVHMAEQSPS